MAYRILLIDDDLLITRSIKYFLKSKDYYSKSVCSGEEAIEILNREDFDLVLLDLSLPGMNGFETMKSIKRDYPDIQVIILTASDQICDVIRAIKLGADDFIIKSSDIEELKVLLTKSIKTYSLTNENIILKKQAEKRIDYDLLSRTESPKMKGVYKTILKVSKLDNSTILIIGESGSGKELVARTIHHLSSRAQKPFIDINCSALPSSLMESELFGFEKGAFTDAKTQKRGLLELTDGGTLFLDEISTLDKSIQAKLLRFLEQRSFRRIGGLVDHKVDIRVLAATNRDLRKKIVTDEFREDLFYRLNVFPITIPPLRERKEDILQLSRFFVEKFNIEFNKHINGISKESIYFLKNYKYPGNVRELKNIIERAMIIEESEFITPSSLHFPHGREFFVEPITVEPEHTQGENNSLRDEDVYEFPSLAEIERRYILKALKKAGGNRAEAAKLLGIGRSTLFRKLSLFDKG